MLETKFISAEETYPLRQTVLRPNRPPEESKFSDDFLESTFHVGSFLNQELLVIATFVTEKPPDQLAQFLNISEKAKSYRLRGMATHDNARRKGLGKKTVEFAEQHLIEQQMDLLWFNARKIAYPFYTNLHYQFFGDEFEIKHIGPHKVMYKILKSDSV